MGKSTPRAPTPPDPAATARAQAQANAEAVRESARVNQINQVTPFGSVTFSGGIGTPDRTQTLSLPPDVAAQVAGQQQIGRGLTEFAQGFVPRASEALADPFSLESLGPAPVPDDLGRQRVEQALFDRLNPQIDRQREQLLTRLANQGIAQGSEAFSNAMEDFNRGVNDLRLGTVAQGGAEQQRLFQLGQQGRQQAISEQLLQRTQPINEIAALLRGSPAIQTPNVQQPAAFGVQPADILGATALNQQAQLANFNADLQRQQGFFGGVGGLAGTLGSAALLGFGG